MAARDGVPSIVAYELNSIPNLKVEDKEEKMIVARRVLSTSVVFKISKI